MKRLIAEHPIISIFIGASLLGALAVLIDNWWGYVVLGIGSFLIGLLIAKIEDKNCKHKVVKFTMLDETDVLICRCVKCNRIVSKEVYTDFIKRKGLS